MINKIIFTLLILTTFHSYSKIANPEEDKMKPELKKELESMMSATSGLQK